MSLAAIHWRCLGAFLDPFFQVGSCSPRAQLIRPPNSLAGAFGMLSMVSKISFRSSFGSAMPPDLVGMPRIGASRLQQGFAFIATNKLKSELAGAHFKGPANELQIEGG